jgi:hypothetical protein
LWGADSFNIIKIFVFKQSRSWKEHGVRKDQVLSLNRHTADEASDLWDFAAEWIEKAVSKGDLPE